jgi:hypothetical protein
MQPAAQIRFGLITTVPWPFRGLLAEGGDGCACIFYCDEAEGCMQAVRLDGNYTQTACCVLQEMLC